MLRILTCCLLILCSCSAWAQRDSARRFGSANRGDDLLINQSGLAIHFDASSAQGEGGTDFAQEFKAYNESGEIVWTFVLNETDVVQSMELTQDQLILVYSEGDRDNVVTLLLVLDTANGEREWLLPVDGKVNRLVPSPNGYFLHYSSSAGTTVARHLAFINGGGQLIWDKVVEEYFGRTTGGDSDGPLGSR